MADIKKKILNAATQTHIPTNWSQIFAEACLKAESRLGFELDAKVSGNGHCIWIIVKPSLNFSEKSASNLNITGLDYYEAGKYEDLTFETQVGFRNYWYTERLFPKLIRYRAIIELIISVLYPSCTFYRKLRFTKDAPRSPRIYSWGCKAQFSFLIFYGHKFIIKTSGKRLVLKHEGTRFGKPQCCK